jgi:G3E family GTPase
MLSTITTGSARVAVVPDDSADETLIQLKSESSPPAHVLVDAGARPRRASGYAYLPGFQHDGVVAVVDPTALDALLSDPATQRDVEDHLRIANLVVLHPTDGVSSAMVADASRRLRMAAPANVVWSGARGVSVELLLGISANASAPAKVTRWAPDYIPDADDNSGWPPARFSLDAADWQLVQLEAGPVSANDFRRWADLLPPSIIRGHGTVTLREMTGARHEFWRFGPQWRLRPRHARTGEGEDTRVTLVGLAREARAPRSSRRRSVAVGPMEPRFKRGHDGDSDPTYNAPIAASPGRAEPSRQT